MRTHSEDQWGGWLMADIALLLVFLIMAGTAADRATPDPSPTPTPPTTSATPTVSPTPSTTPEGTPSAEPRPEGLDREAVEFMDIAVSKDQLDDVAGRIAAQIEADGRKPGLIMVFGTAFQGTDKTSGQRDLAEPVERYLRERLKQYDPLIFAYLSVPAPPERPHGRVSVDVYFYHPGG